MRITTDISFSSLTEQLQDRLGTHDRIALVGSLLRSIVQSSNKDLMLANAGYVPASALGDAAKRLDFAANWIENSYSPGGDKNTQLIRSYARDARRHIVCPTTEA